MSNIMCEDDTLGFNTKVTVTLFSPARSSHNTTGAMAWQLDPCGRVIGFISIMAKVNLDSFVAATNGATSGPLLDLIGVGLASQVVLASLLDRIGAEVGFSVSFLLRSAWIIS